MSEAVKQEPRVLPYVMAINEGVREVLREQDNAFVAGEDVAGAGGVYGYYTGVLDEFGPERVYDTPISEKRSGRQGSPGCLIAFGGLFALIGFLQFARAYKLRTSL